MLKAFVVISDQENEYFEYSAWVIFAHSPDQAIKIAQREADDTDPEYQCTYDCIDHGIAPEWAWRGGVCQNKEYARSCGLLFGGDIDCDDCGQPMDSETDPHWHVNEEFNYCLDCEKRAREDAETVLLINGADDADNIRKVRLVLTPKMAQGLLEVLQSLPPGHAVDNATQAPDPVLDDFIKMLRAKIESMKWNKNGAEI